MAMAAHSIVQASFFVLACSVAGAVLMDNHPLRDFSVQWRPIPHIVSTGRPLGVNRRVTSVMAGLTLLSAFASVLAKEEHLTVVHLYYDDRGVQHQHERVALGLSWAVLLIVSAGCMLATDAHFTFYRYKIGRQLSNKTVPHWQSVVAYSYIWLFIATPWFMMNVLEQMNVRNEKFYEERGLNQLYTVGAIHSLLTVPLHILWSCFMLLVFLRGLNGLRQQVEAQRLLARAVVLQAVTIRSVVYVVVSLSSSLYCWAIFSVYPWCIYISVTAMPYHIVQTLVTHLCFNVRTLRLAEEEALSQLPSVPGLAATPEASPQQQEGIHLPDGCVQQAAPLSPVRQRPGPSSQRRAWRAWRLPSVSSVQSNPWDVERGVMDRISEADASSASLSSSPVVPGQSGSAGSAAAGSLHALPSERSEGETIASKGEI